MMIYLYYGEVN